MHTVLALVTGQCIHTITRATVTMVYVTTSAPGAAWAREEWREFLNLMSCCWRCREVSGDQANVWIYLAVIYHIYYLCCRGGVEHIFNTFYATNKS